MAQWNMSKVKEKRSVNNFEDGVNNGTSPFYVGNNAIVGGYGWDFENYPALRVRKGRISHGASISGVTRLLANFSNSNLVRAVGNRLQYYDGAWADIPGSYADIDWDYANFDVGGKALLMVNPTDGGFYWNRTSAIVNSIPDMPKGKYMTSDNLRVYVAGTTVDGTEDYLYYSAFQDGLDWTSPENSGIVQYYTSSGEKITAIHAFGTGIWVFKKDSFAIMYHTGDSRLSYRLQPISNNIGCVAYRTVLEVGPYLLWLGRDNVYIGAGDGAKAIGHDIKGYLDSINVNAVGNSFAFGNDTRYYLCIPTGNNTFPDTCIVYDYEFKKWLPYSTSLDGLRCSAKLDGKSYAADDKGRTFVMNESEFDLGQPVQWLVRSRPFDEGIKEAEKELYEMHIQGFFPQGTTLNVRVSPDAAGTVFYNIDYDPIASSNVTVNKNLIVPLDTMPLANFYAYIISGAGLAEIQEIQRYARIMPVMH